MIFPERFYAIGNCVLSHKENPAPFSQERDFLCRLLGDFVQRRGNTKACRLFILENEFYSFYRKFIKVVKIIELKKSTNKLPTRGTMKNARGAAP